MYRFHSQYWDRLPRVKPPRPPRCVFTFSFLSTGHLSHAMTSLSPTSRRRVRWEWMCVCVWRRGRGQRVGALIDSIDLAPGGSWRWWRGFPSSRTAADSGSPAGPWEPDVVRSRVGRSWDLTLRHGFVTSLDSDEWCVWVLGGWEEAYPLFTYGCHQHTEIIIHVQFVWTNHSRGVFPNKLSLTDGRIFLVNNVLPKTTKKGKSTLHSIWGKCFAPNILNEAITRVVKSDDTSLHYS